jgi:fatty acid desaturase
VGDKLMTANRVDTTAERPRDPPIAQELLRTLQRRSDSRGVLRLLGHLAFLVATGGVYTLALARSAPLALVALAAVAYGFTLVTMFAAMHESVHRTAFKTPALNDGVAWFAGLLSFYNSSFYRPYHGWHHRFTQIPGKDPELEDRKPTGFASYVIEISGLTWWIGKLKTHFRLALGKSARYGFLNDGNAPGVIRSVRWQFAVYAAAIVASVLLGYPWFVTHWLLPVVLAQPLLRVILLAEHTGCSNDDDALANTRTTHTSWPVRFLMWEMPYHAEHHHYPALPFFALAEAHEVMGTKLRHVARSGYLGLHADFLKGLKKNSALERAA